MAGRDFLDTNVLAYTDDRDEPEKRAIAIELLDRSVRARTCVLSTQVLQEYFVAATRKLGVSAEVAQRKVAALATLDVVVVRPEMILGAIDLHRLHGIHFFDALVVKCASTAGCARLLSEDMQHGAVIDGVRIENPFLALGKQPEA